MYVAVFFTNNDIKKKKEGKKTMQVKTLSKGTRPSLYIYCNRNNITHRLCLIIVFLHGTRRR